MGEMLVQCVNLGTKAPVKQDLSSERAGDDFQLMWDTSCHGDSGNNSGLLGADRGVSMEWGAVILDGGIRVGVSKAVCVLVWCSCVP